MESKVFIGSSRESLKYAEIVKTELESYKDCKCLIWNENFFELNLSTYENLYKKANGFDFAIFIGGEDSTVKERGKLKTKPRDNVIFELGLYAGVLSSRRTYLMLHKKCEIFSDFKGNTISIFSNKREIINACKEIHKHMKEEREISRLSSMPSTALAISYFNNYLKNIEKWIEQSSKITLDAVDYSIDNLEIEINVVLPKNISSTCNSIDWGFYKEEKLKEISVSYSKNKRSLLLRVKEEKMKKGYIQIYDVPTILDTAFLAVDLLEGKDFIGDNERITMLKEKEICNFKKTLEIMAKTSEWLEKRLRFIERG